MPRVVHFEILADQPAESQKFWSDVFDWKIQQWDGSQPYWLVSTGDDKDMGINGGLMKRTEDLKGVNSILVLGVDSIDKTAAKVAAAGGTEHMAKVPVGEMGWVAYFKDTEGTIFGVWESNPNAPQG